MAANRFWRRCGSVVRQVAILALGVSLLSGCRRASITVYVPLQESAQSQYRYAIDHRGTQELLLRDKGNPARLMRARQQVMQTFDKVVEFFPQDRLGTPLAKLEIAEMMAGLDISNLRPSKKELRGAIDYLQDLRADYPEIEYIQAKALLDEALCWNSLQRYDRGQPLLRRVADAYATHEDDIIRTVGRYAAFLYQQIYVQ